MSASDFFRKFQPLFEDKVTAKKAVTESKTAKPAKLFDNLKTDKQITAEGMKYKYDQFTGKQQLSESKDNDYSGSDKTTKELKKNPGSDIHKPTKKELEKDKKASNVKENAADFFRKYSDMIAEAETAADREDDEDDTNADEEDDGLETQDEGKTKSKNLPPWLKDKKEVKESYDDEDEDPDVAKADKEKGKDGKTQKDADKKLPPWLKKNIDKADKKDEEKGAKKAKSEELDEQRNSDLAAIKAAKEKDAKRKEEKAKTTAKRIKP
jgi:hypothetical protein